MKSKRRHGELFSLSFLDIICCGFGAMVMLVLLSKPDVGSDAPDTDSVADLLTTLSAEQKRQATNRQTRDRLSAETRRLEAEIRKLGASPDLADLKQRLAEARAQARILQIRTGASASAAATGIGATDKVVKVGGIPVDSNYIIFIVDTSGSMQTIWTRVIAELENVLDIHPQVEGFQIMNDNGVYLIKSYAGRWMRDTPARRKSVLNAMRTWRSFSNSSPVEGLQKALKTYAQHTENLAIYIFGDDYSGASYDTVLNAVSTLNRDPKTGNPIARIHGIGFQQKNGVASRFATLMREVARRNRGAFIALGLKNRSEIVESNRPNRN